LRQCAGMSPDAEQSSRTIAVTLGCEAPAAGHTPRCERERPYDAAERSPGSPPNRPRDGPRRGTRRRLCRCLATPRAIDIARRTDLCNARRSLQLIPRSWHRARTGERARCALDPAWLSGSCRSDSRSSCLCARPRPGLRDHGRRGSRRRSRSWRPRLSSFLASCVWRFRLPGRDSRRVYRVVYASRSHGEAAPALACAQVRGSSVEAGVLRAKMNRAAALFRTKCH
jgi:hypothetical protein